MDEINYFSYNSISADDILDIYENAIIADSRFIDTVDKNNITVEVSYQAYTSFDGLITNHKFFYQKNDEIINGLVDASLIYKSPKLTLLDINIDDFTKCDREENIYNDDYSSLYKEFISRIEGKLQENAYTSISRHKEKRDVLDIAPIDSFTTLTINRYLEKIYIIRYHAKEDYISIYSSYHSMFYVLDFEKSKKYKNHIATHKSPISYIPKELYPRYYHKTFLVYLRVESILKNMSDDELYKKIKRNREYKSSSIHNSYIDIAIYYYKSALYFKYTNIPDGSIIDKILYCLLSYKYDKDAGVYLYNAYRIGLLDIKEKKALSYLWESYYLDSIEAKKALYTYFSRNITYDARILRKLK